MVKFGEKKEMQERGRKRGDDIEIRDDEVAEADLKVKLKFIPQLKNNTNKRTNGKTSRKAMKVKFILR